ncbi:MAG TPA: putative baseplate assembly protein, partial [Pyrinomonadaceae bacterium]
KIQLLPAHNKIFFYTWGDARCCLEKGSTSATLLDTWIVLPDEDQNGDNQYNQYKKQYKGKPEPEPEKKKERELKLKPGDVLIFEEVLGPITGLPADADPSRRHAVRITSVKTGEDTLRKTKDGFPTPYVKITWAAEDALPFTFCISAIGGAPDCVYLENVSVARGNVVLADHGKTQPEEPFGPVATKSTDAECECVDEAGDVRITPRRLSPALSKAPVTFSAALPKEDPYQAPASAMLDQDPRAAVANVAVASEPEHSWENRYDLLASGPDDKHFVVEIDNFGHAHIRFGNGTLGFQPPAGMTFNVRYRVGNGIAGNVGAESISRLVLNKTTLSGVSLKIRNPLPARGGTQPEPVAEAKLFAPHAFRKELQRAIIADDYQTIAARNNKLQRAAGALVWTGSWYEADVAVDPIGSQSPDESLLNEIKATLERYRRLGHDRHVETAEYVPLLLSLEVCALPNYQPAHIKAALLDVFSNRTYRGGKKGFFHPDNLTFGEGIHLSKIIAAAQAVTGVECVRVKKFQRLFESANHEIANGVLPLSPTEIALLDNDPNFPEHGRLEIHMGGGK